MDEPANFFVLTPHMSTLKTIKLPVSANLKVFLVILAIGIVAGTLVYVQGLVNDLRAAERRTIRFYASTFQSFISAPQDDSPYSEIASELALQTSDILYFPVIVTDDQNIPISNPIFDTATMEVVGHEWLAKNVEVDTSMTQEEQQQELIEQMAEMKESYQPLPIYSVFQVEKEIVPANPVTGDSGVVRLVNDSTIYSYLYFDDSRSIKQLQLLPWIEMLIISIFIIIGYVGFSHIKRSEQSNIWVGMAKETAHQLGTPLSSMMGWIELLKLDPDDADQVVEAAGEMSRDVDRLTMVAQRFSKIGSAAQTKQVDLNDVLTGVVRYFDRRLPHLGKRINLQFHPAPEPVRSDINVDLFQWVFENLIRNAADAIERQEGEIDITTSRSRGHVQIDVRDNGKGIDPKIRKDIFRPGFSTKQRGWGLGLSLAKRIVEEYHGGKIFIRDSTPEGTTFTIRLKESQGDESQTSPPAAERSA